MEEKDTKKTSKSTSASGKKSTTSKVVKDTNKKETKKTDDKKATKVKKTDSKSKDTKSTSTKKTEVKKSTTKKTPAKKATTKKTVTKPRRPAVNDDVKEVIDTIVQKTEQMNPEIRDEVHEILKEAKSDIHNIVEEAVIEEVSTMPEEHQQMYYNYGQPVKKKFKWKWLLIVVLIIVLGAGIYCFLNTVDDDDSEGGKSKDKTITGSTWGDRYADYIEEEILDDGIDSIESYLIDVDGNGTPEMVLVRDSGTFTTTRLLYLDKNKVEESTSLIDHQPRLLFSVNDGGYEWYFSRNNYDGSPIDYVRMESYLIYNVSDEDEDDYVLVFPRLVKRSEIGETYVEITPEFENITINKKSISKDVKKLVSGYNKNIVSDDIKSEAKDKIAEIKQEAYNKRVAITQNNYKSRIGDHLKWFVGAYYGPDYGWIEVFNYQDRTSSVKIPGQSKDEMVTEIVGLSSINSLKTQLRNYVSEDKWNKLPYKVGEGFTEYDGKVYRVRGGIGCAGYFDLDRPEIISSENGITKVRLSAYHCLFDGKIEDVTLTITYNKTKDSYLITDWEAQKYPY